MAKALPSGTGIARIIVSVASIPKAIMFYRDVLALPIESLSGEFARLRTAGGVELMLHQRPSTPSDAAVAVGFFVRDAAGVVQRWQELGGTVVDPLSERPWGERMAVIRDADGHLVCVSSR